MRILCFFVLVLGLALPAAAEERALKGVALVIGLADDIDHLSTGGGASIRAVRDFSGRFAGANGS